jgi:hypothetical protein
MRSLAVGACLSLTISVYMFVKAQGLANELRPLLETRTQLLRDVEDVRFRLRSSLETTIHRLASQIPVDDKGNLELAEWATKRHAELAIRGRGLDDKIEHLERLVMRWRIPAFLLFIVGFSALCVVVAKFRSQRVQSSGAISLR